MTETALLVAAILVLALSCTAFAYGEEIAQQFIMLTGTTIREGIDEAGNSYLSAIGSKYDEDIIPATVEDGRIYFTLNGAHEDITDQCGADRYFHL